MTALMSANAFDTEQEHIREQISQSAENLAKRQTKWTVGSVAGLILAVLAFAAGLAMVAAGELPASVTIGTVQTNTNLQLNIPTTTESVGKSIAQSTPVDPELADLVMSFQDGAMDTLLRIISMAMVVVGVAMGVIKQNVFSMVAGLGGGLAINQFPSVLGAMAGMPKGEAAVPAQTKNVEPVWADQLRKAFERKEWGDLQALANAHGVDANVLNMQEVDRLAKTQLFNEAIRNSNYELAMDVITDPAMSDTTGLHDKKARIHHHLGQHAEAAELVREHKLFSDHEGAAWYMENAWANVDENGFMSKASQAYYENQKALVEKGTYSLWLSGLLLVLAIAAAIVMADLGRNLRKLDEWLKGDGAGDGESGTEASSARYPVPPHPPEARTTA